MQQPQEAAAPAKEAPQPLHFVCGCCVPTFNGGPFYSQQEAEAAVAAHEAEAIYRQRDRLQAFFFDYELQIRKPHFGPLHREVITEMLKRAIEQGFYVVPKEG